MRSINFRIAVTMLTCAGVFLILMLLPIPEFSTAIPKQMPNETNRVYHEVGFSIIAPSNWVHVISPTDETYGRTTVAPTIDCFQKEAAKFSSTMRVTVLSSDPREIRPFPKETTLWNNQAWEYSERLEANGNRPPSFEYGLCCWKDEQWCVFRVSVYGSVESLPSIFRKYFESYTYSPTK